MGKYRVDSHRKYKLLFHLIFVCKYRKPLLSDHKIDDDIKKLLKEIFTKHGVLIKHMESDKDHMHLMIETTPSIKLSDLVRTVKSYTTYHIWLKNEKYLKTTFGEKGHFGQTDTL